MKLDSTFCYFEKEIGGAHKTEKESLKYFVFFFKICFFFIILLKKICK